MPKIIRTAAKILDNISATTTSGDYDTADADTVVLVAAGASTPNYNLKVRGGPASCDFTQASSPSNPWTYLAFVNDDTGSTVAGSTGATINTTTAVRLRLPLGVAVSKIAVEATRTGGNLTVWAESFTTVN